MSIARTIWKYEIDVTDVQELKLPGDAYILPFAHAVNATTINLWAEVDPGRQAQYRTIVIVGTGNPLPAGSLSYLASVVAPPFVWHIYEGEED